MDGAAVPFDLTRMFLGSEPPLFYLEIVVRTVVIYSYSLALIRWVGGRGIAQMSTVEFLLVIALGSAVGDAMFYPEVPLLHAMLVITLVVLINKALDSLISRSEGFERLMDGSTAEVVRNGVINLRVMRANSIGRSELFESMRENGFDNLGQLQRAYLETSGKFSFFKQTSASIGLPVEPAWSVDPPPTFGQGHAIPAGSSVACCSCGHVLPTTTNTTPSACPNCGRQVWTLARVTAADSQVVQLKR